MAESDGQQGQPDQGGNSPAEGGAGGAGSPAPAATRPDDVPEKFWDATAGAVRVDAVLKSYSELEKGWGKARETALAEAMAKVREGVPEAADKYALEPVGLPDDVVFVAGEMPAEFEPGKTYFALNAAAPEVAALREWAHAEGVKGEGFQKLLGIAARAMGTRVPTAEERAAERGEFYKALGENGEARAQHLWGQIKGMVSPELAAEADALLGSKGGFEFVEALVTRAGGAGFAAAGAGITTGAVTEASLREAMRDPRYLTDKAYADQVTQGWTKLYGGQSMDGSRMGRAVA